jgi:hypothetical protein
MVLIIRANGQYWDGLGWNTKGKVFLSLASATRSLHEEGESLEGLEIISKDFSQETNATT